MSFRRMSFRQRKIMKALEKGRPVDEKSLAKYVALETTLRGVQGKLAKVEAIETENNEKEGFSWFNNGERPGRSSDDMIDKQFAKITDQLGKDSLFRRTIEDLERGFND